MSSPGLKPKRGRPNGGKILENSTTDLRPIESDSTKDTDQENALIIAPDVKPISPQETKTPSKKKVKIPIGSYQLNPASTTFITREIPMIVVMKITQVDIDQWLNPKIDRPQKQEQIVI